MKSAAAVRNNVVQLPARSPMRTLTEVEDPVRPYRLWNANLKQQVRYRYYGESRRAHQAALIETRWAKVDTVIEVYDARNGHLLGQYKRTPTSISFMRG